MRAELSIIGDCANDALALMKHQGLVHVHWELTRHRRLQYASTAQPRDVGKHPAHTPRQKLHRTLTVVDCVAK